jgi:hypothetical protein
LDDTKHNGSRKDFAQLALAVVTAKANRRAAGKNAKAARLVAHLLPPEGGGRWESPRARAAKLRLRMAQFSRIYNAAYMVRYAQHGRPERRLEYVQKFVAVLEREIQRCEDPEALIFAVADALTAFPTGLPWEG